MMLSLKEWEKVDVSAMALDMAQTTVQQHPVVVSLWVFGLLLVAFAGGLPVDDTAKEAYSVMRQQAEVIDSRELGAQALVELEQAEQAYYFSKGWFGACDDACIKAKDRYAMAAQQAERVQQHRDRVLSEARQEVGIWSAFGVQDVRNAFWAAWKSGKDFAARCTMYNAFFMAGGGRQESLYAMIFKLIIQYVVNLTMGLIGAFVYFMYNLYCLIISYGSSVLSGLAFFLLAIMAGLSMLATYLGAMYGAVVGGGVLLLQQAAKQAALEADPHQRAGRRALADRYKDIV